MTFHADVSMFFTSPGVLNYFEKLEFCAGIPGQHSGTEQLFRAYFFDAW